MSDQCCILSHGFWMWCLWKDPCVCVNPLTGLLDAPSSSFPQESSGFNDVAVFPAAPRCFQVVVFCVFSPFDRPPSLPSSHPPHSVSIFLPFFIYNLPHTPSFSNSIAVSCFGRTCWAGAKAIMRTVRRRQMNRWEKKREGESEVKGGQGRDMNMKQWHCSHYWQFTHACVDTQVQCRAAAWAHKQLPGKEGPEDDSIQCTNAEFSE